MSEEMEVILRNLKEPTALVRIKALDTIGKTFDLQKRDAPET